MKWNHQVYFCFNIATVVSENEIKCLTPQTELLTEVVKFRLKEQANRIFNHLDLEFYYIDMVS
jgi:hypothetical protein